MHDKTDSGGAGQGFDICLIDVSVDRRPRSRCKFDYGFAIDWMRKDLRIALEEARANGSRLPVAALVDQFYADVQEMGGNRWDTSSLIARLTRGEGHGDKPE